MWCDSCKVWMLIGFCDISCQIGYLRYNFELVFYKENSYVFSKVKNYD